MIHHPTLYQINARTWLQKKSTQIGRPATLDDISDAELDELAGFGFHWVYLLGVWQTGEYGRREALNIPRLFNEYRMLLPDFTADDVCGSCFAVQNYLVSDRLGGEKALANFRQRLNIRGIRLMLDFVPNHTAVDHPWVAQFPDYYVAGTQEDLTRAPYNYIQLETSQGRRILAHGRDPYFPAWSDTMQLNYGNPQLQEAMRAELLSIAGRCDGVRCDMAMLLLPGVFQRVWNIIASPFWPAAIEQVIQEYPEFIFMAEVYWGLEWTLQQQGFHYTYDKTLYDRIRDLHAQPVREHLWADAAYQNRLARFLENHDEQRAASVFVSSIHPAAAVITYLNPGLRFFHQGQLEGYHERVPVQLCRAPDQKTDDGLQSFYSQLLACLQHPAFHYGRWQLLDALPQTDEEIAWQDAIAWFWSGPADEIVLCSVNYSPIPANFMVRLSIPSLANKNWVLRDFFGKTQKFISGNELIYPGAVFRLAAWGYSVLEISPAE